LSESETGPDKTPWFRSRWIRSRFGQALLRLAIGLCGERPMTCPLCDHDVWTRKPGVVRSLSPETPPLALLTCEKCGAGVYIEA